MGSPWPWPQEPLKQHPQPAPPINSIQNNNNNNNHNIKRTTSYGYDSYAFYNNHHNHDFHQPMQYPSARIIPSMPASQSEHILGHDLGRRRSYPYFTFDGGTTQQSINNNNNNNNLGSSPHHRNKSSTQQSQFATYVKEIPTWNIYYSDQKHRIIDFTDKNNSIQPDSFINQLVSLCFVDTCITNLAVDAIVNSTTENYCGVAGVDRVIHQQAGRNLREICKSIPRLGPGKAEMTPGYSLPAKYVIHTNGPLTEDAEQLTGCYVNSFNLLLMHRLRTIAFPCISTGKKGLTKKFAAEVALKTVRRFLEEHKHEVDRVIFCLHHQKDIEIYLRYMQIYFPVVDPDFHITTT